MVVIPESPRERTAPGPTKRRADTDHAVRPVAPPLPACSPSPMSTTDPNLPPPLDRDFVGYGRTPPHAGWPRGARVAVNFVLTYEEGRSDEGRVGEGGVRQV